jgi:hypothetical protein
LTGGRGRTAARLWTAGGRNAVIADDSKNLGNDASM